MAIVPDNAGAGSSGAASSAATAVQNDGSGGGGGATSRPNVPVESDDEVVFLRTSTASTSSNNPRKRRRKTKEEKDDEREARNNRIKSDQLCPICQESLNTNLEDPEKQKIVIDGGKVLIGDQRVKILKCCGNTIHYTCFIRYVEANKNKDNLKCPFNDELGKVQKVPNGVEDFVDKWLRDPNGIVRKEIPAHSKIVYRVSCQLKF